MLRTPPACAPSRSDSSPAIVVSRGVRCGIVSTPVKRSIATEAMIPLIRARARGLSLTSRNCARPDSRTARAVSISASGLAPSGGSTCTESANSPSRRSRDSWVSPVAGSNGATCSRSWRRKEPGGRPGAVVGAVRGEAEWLQARRRILGLHACERLAPGVEGEERDDGQRRDRADCTDGRLQLVEVVERLDHEEVDPASLENLRL